MITEYLLYNMVVISGPLSLSFDKKVHFISDWGRTFKSIAIVGVPFIIWDFFVTGRHWWFNPFHTLPFRFFGLPPGEILFFVSVPFACIFVWRVLQSYIKLRVNTFTIPYIIPTLLIIVAIALLIPGKEYTAIVLTVAAITLFLDRLSGLHLYRHNHFGMLMGIVFLLILVFNGYLTARPVVLYGIEYQMDWRIYTIPVEDFFYGLSHIYLSVLCFEWLGSKKAKS